MTRLAKLPFPAIFALIWVGFVCAISFMEAWLKFRAPLVTLPIGLSIGQVVFHALNRMEWLFAALILAFLAIGRSRMQRFCCIILCPALLILAAQTLFMLPALNARAVLIAQQTAPPPSPMHLYYLILEAAKVICLLAFGALSLESGAWGLSRE